MIQAEAAPIQALKKAYDGLGDVRPLSALTELVKREKKQLAPKDKIALVDQALIVLDELYVHMQLKRARHASDPIRALRLLRQRLEAAHQELDDLAFHSELMAIFKSLHDVHTAYTPPLPYPKTIAFLPFLMERYYEARAPRYAVTRTLDGFEHPTFRRGVEITAWNGAPVQRAVERNADREAGSNPAARLALSVLYMTVRWLGASLPPDEHWVIVGYRDGGKEREIRLPWYLLVLSDGQIEVAEQAVWLLETSGPTGLSTGLNVRTHVEHLARRRLFAGDKVREHLANRDTYARNISEVKLRASTGVKGESLTADTNAPVSSKVPSNITFLEAKMISRNDRDPKFGYIRIRAFQVDIAAFVGEFRRLLSLMPENGLILDVRGNPGGVIQNAETILQLLTPETITPLAFQFIGSSLTDQLTHPDRGLSREVFDSRKKFAKWGNSIDVSLETGGVYSNGEPLTLAADANQFGQEYYGPVVLITDAITYSAGDMFAAGFQDHGIGKILGADENTGAGGANQWTQSDVRKLLPEVDKVQPLPASAGMHFAVRRCIRQVGNYAGMPIEELGIRPDERHWMTQTDLLKDNADLLDVAMKMLSGVPARMLKVTAHAEKTVLRVRATTTGIDRLDFYIDGRPLASPDVKPDIPCEVELGIFRNEADLEVRGYEDRKLVARHKQKIRVGPPASPFSRTTLGSRVTTRSRRDATKAVRNPKAR